VKESRTSLSPPSKFMGFAISRFREQSRDFDPRISCDDRRSCNDRRFGHRISVGSEKAERCVILRREKKRENSSMRN